MAPTRRRSARPAGRMRPGLWCRPTEMVHPAGGGLGPGRRDGKPQPAFPKVDRADAEGASSCCNCRAHWKRRTEASTGNLAAAAVISGKNTVTVRGNGAPQRVAGIVRTTAEDSYADSCSRARLSARLHGGRDGRVRRLPSFSAVSFSLRAPEGRLGTCAWALRGRLRTSTLIDRARAGAEHSRQDHIP